MNRIGLGAIGTIVILAATLGASAVTERTTSPGLRRHLDAFPTQLGGWDSTSPAELLDPKVEKTLGASEYTQRIFTREGSAVELFVAYYANQRAGESMHSPLNCLPGAGWEFSARDVALVDANGTQVRVNNDRIQNGGTRAVILYWYQTPARIFASEYLGKLYLVWDSIRSARGEGAIVRLTVSDRPGAVEDAKSLASLVIPQVQGSFAP